MTSLGRYQLVRPLGRGGMAEVFLACRRVAGIEKWLVVKRLRPERASDPRFLQSFQREARLSLGLSHRNIVPVFDFGRIGDDVFLAMERVDGPDLAATLDRVARPLAPLIAAYIAAECCAALEYAHQRRGGDGVLLGVVHRDVTPANILLSWSGEVKLSDFGIAALAGDRGGASGTAAYMAPEQARGEAVDATADLYALGLVLLEMLHGERARPGAGRDELLEVARRGDPVQPRAAVPAELAAIIRRACDPDASARFPDASSMHAALDRYLVAARATATGPAPDRQLASVLHGAWGEPAREPAGGPDQAVVGDLVSMLEDAPGQATMRSGLATRPPGEAELAPSPPPVVDAADEAEAGRRSVVPAPSQRLEVAPRPGRIPSAWRWGVAASVLAVGAWMAWSQVRSPGRPAAPVSTADQVVPGLAPAPVPVQAAAAAGRAAIPAAADPGATRPEPAAGPDEAEPAAPAPRGAARRPPRSTSAEALAARRVSVGSVPWANFTVDGDAKVHQTPEVVVLPPGRHTLSFENPELGLRRRVEIDVPVDQDLRVLEHLGPEPR